ncbi:MAG TPA: DinB family protein [Terriglobales bacterium]|nr:DinB family protein [Terriglobales bacterium]
MDLRGHYQQLASYDEWANLEVVAALQSAGRPLDRPLKLLAHIIGAEHVWLTRIRQTKPPLPVWPDLTLEECGEHVRGLAKSWRELLSGTGDVLDRMVAYKNSKGEAYESLVRDILTHVFMHSAYHRGQIAADVRQAGFVPAYTDFIHGVRQGLIE